MGGLVKTQTLCPTFQGWKWQVVLEVMSFQADTCTARAYFQALSSLDNHSLSAGRKVFPKVVPPSLPEFVLEYFVAHPFSWLWTTRAGPNKGKSVSVPHIPTNCSSAAHRAVRWTVDLFHSFKAHLSPGALDSQGWVPPPLLRMYHNNMLRHYHCQAVGCSGSPLGRSSLTYHMHGGAHPATGIPLLSPPTPLVEQVSLRFRSVVAHPGCPSPLREALLALDPIISAHPPEDAYGSFAWSIRTLPPHPL